MCSAVNNMNRVHTAALTNIHVSAAVLISTLCNHVIVPVHTLSP